MAKFSCTGLDELNRAFSKSAELPVETKNAILTAMATVVKDAQYSVGKSKNIYNPESSTHILDKMKINKPKLTDNGGSVTITFPGTRTDKKHNKVHNSTIAFFNEFGKKGQPARPFISVAIEKSKDDMNAAGQAELNKYIDSLFGK